MNYFWRCIKKAFGGWLGRADTLSGIVTAILTAISQLNPWWDETVNTLLWIIPLSLLGVTIVIGLIISPYLVHRDDSKEIARLRRELQANKKSDYSIVWGDVETYWVSRPLGEKGSEKYSFEIATEDDTTNLLLEGVIMLPTSRKITIKSLELEIEGVLAPSLSWEEGDFYPNSFAQNVTFVIPTSVQRGKRVARIKAIVDNEDYLGDNFTINLPYRK
jgi:hypothetical protein